MMTHSGLLKMSTKSDTLSKSHFPYCTLLFSVNRLPLQQYMTQIRDTSQGDAAWWLVTADL